MSPAPSRSVRRSGGKRIHLLLVNPNRYHEPPVPPLALEHLAAAASQAGHDVRLLDLCFSPDPAAEIDAAMADFAPDIAGVTVRNIDTVLCENNEFFLDGIAETVGLIRAHGVPTVIGGAGFSFIPAGILRYLGGDWGVFGPGEGALVHLLGRMSAGDPPARGTVLNGWAFETDPSRHVPRGKTFDYAPYLAGRGLAGFETQSGCRERCGYCAEGRGTVRFRDPAAVVRELADLADLGITRLHLCDTEFNQDMTHARRVLEAIIGNGPTFTWSLYLKSAPVDAELYRLLAKSGAGTVTLSLPTGNGDWLDRAADHARFARDAGLPLAVDLLIGFPGQTIDEVRRIIDRLAGIAPDTVGVNSTIRLYPSLPLTGTVLSSPEHRGRMFGALNGNPDYIRPVFYRWLTVDVLRELIGDYRCFKIEGFDRSSNYERLGG